TFTFHPSGPIQNPRVAGEWQGFDLATAPAMTGPDKNGVYSVTVNLSPGLQAYKLVYDQNGGTPWVLDPEQGSRKYVGGIENSAVKVPDCSLPSFHVESSQPARPAPGQGTYTAKLSWQGAIDGSCLDTKNFTAILQQDDTQTPLGAPDFVADPATGEVSISLK